MPRSSSRQGSAKSSPRHAGLAGQEAFQSSALVLDAFSVERAGGSALAMMLREFASRMMMMFDIGAASGANFSEYWQTVIDVRGFEFARELKPMGDLFRFVYHHALLTEHSSETNRIDKLNVTKTDLHRAKIADQVQGALDKIQASMDEVLRQWHQPTSGAASQRDQAREALHSTLRALEDISEDHMRALSVPTAALNTLVTKARDGVMTANRNPSHGSPSAAMPERPVVQTVASTGTESTFSPRKTTANTAQLPVLSASRPLRVKQIEIQLPVRPFVSPFQIRPQFDVPAFEAQAARQQRLSTLGVAGSVRANEQATAANCEARAIDGDANVSVLERLQRVRQSGAES